MPLTAAFVTVRIPACEVAALRQERGQTHEGHEQNDELLELLLLCAVTSCSSVPVLSR